MAEWKEFIRRGLVANNLVKLSDSVSNQIPEIFARYSPVPKSRARIAYSTISDAIIAVRLEWEGLTIC